MSIQSISMARINHEKIIFIVVATCLILISEAEGGRTNADLEIRRQLKHLNKPAVKSIKVVNFCFNNCEFSFERHLS